MTAILIPVSYHCCVIYSFCVPFFLLWLPNSLSPCIYSIFLPTDRPPSLLRSHSIALSFPATMTPHNSLRAPARKVDITGINLVESATPLRQANLSSSNHLIECAQPCYCSVVLFHRSSELLDNLVVIGPLRS